MLQLMEEMFDDALLIERDAYIDFMPDDERARADDLVEKLLKIDALKIGCSVIWVMWDIYVGTVTGQEAEPFINLRSVYRFCNLMEQKLECLRKYLILSLYK